MQTCSDVDSGNPSRKLLKDHEGTSLAECLILLRASRIGHTARTALGARALGQLLKRKKLLMMMMMMKMNPGPVKNAPFQSPSSPIPGRAPRILK